MIFVVKCYVHTIVTVLTGYLDVMCHLDFSVHFSILSNVLCNSHSSTCVTGFHKEPSRKGSEIPFKAEFLVPSISGRTVLLDKGRT